MFLFSAFNNYDVTYKKQKIIKKYVQNTQKTLYIYNN